MKRKWIAIAAVSALAITGGLVAGGVSIYNKIDYDVVSYNIVSIGTNGMTLQVVFAVSNDSKFDVDLWNQYYDIYVSGYKVSEITSLDRYKILAGNTSLLPLNVDLFWDELQAAYPSIGSQLQVSSLESLPVVIRGRLAARVGMFQLKKIPVRYASTVGYFLP
jgi:LEA14-like dessication related protein